MEALARPENTSEHNRRPAAVFLFLSLSLAVSFIILFSCCPRLLLRRRQISDLDFAVRRVREQEFRSFAIHNLAREEAVRYARVSLFSLTCAFPFILGRAIERERHLKHV